MGLNLKLIGFIPILFLLCSVASAVTVPSNITINLTDVNLTVDNLTFDSVVIGIDTIAFNDSGNWSNFTVLPNEPTSVNITKWNVTGDYQKSWNKTGDASVSYTISGLPPYTYINVTNVNNTVLMTSRALGLITFTSTGIGTYEIITGESSLIVDKAEEDQIEIESVKTSFTQSWENTVAMIGVIIIISLTGSILLMLRGKKHLRDIVYELPEILIVVTLLIIGAIIFGQF